MDLKKEAAATAVTLIQNGNIIGLGAGATIAYLVVFLQETIEKGLAVKVLTSSIKTKELLKQNNIEVFDTNSFSQIDLYLDGCDQFDKDLHALKSGGGIHTHEKLLATMATEFVIVGDESKYVEKLDTKFPLVIEVLPEAAGFVPAKVKQIFHDVKTSIRMNANKDQPVITENKNYLFDCWFTEWPELSSINPGFKNITGVVETSLFYNIARMAIVAGENGIRIIEKS
jgi:ribose 5-phosphate isomerase A